MLFLLANEKSLALVDDVVTYEVGESIGRRRRWFFCGFDATVLHWESQIFYRRTPKWRPFVMRTKSKEDYGETFDPFITRFPLPIYEEPEKKREMIRLLGSNPGQHQRTAWPTKRKRKGEPPFFLFCFYQSYGRFGARYEAIDGGNSFVSS